MSMGKTPGGDVSVWSTIGTEFADWETGNKLATGFLLPVSYSALAVFGLFPLRGNRLATGFLLPAPVRSELGAKGTPSSKAVPPLEAAHI